MEDETEAELVHEWTRICTNRKENNRILRPSKNAARHLVRANYSQELGRDGQATDISELSFLIYSCSFVSIRGPIFSSPSQIIKHACKHEIDCNQCDDSE